MSIELNHLIVWASDQVRSAKFLADMLGLPEPIELAHFNAVEIGGIFIDFADKKGPLNRQHLAFLISEEEFDQVLKRIKSRNVPHWADPIREVPGEINYDDGGRGVYFADPDDHNWEVMTKPYGRESLKKNRLFN